MAVRFQLRRDTAANWTSTNPVLALGEPGVETDTLKVKVGDGVTAWNSLGYSITKDFTELTSKPTTIAGYGITDAVASSSVSVFGASLIDDADATTARTTLGLGTAATTAATAYATAAQGSTADTAVQPGDNIQTSIIDSADSSAITITPDVVMSAGLTVGNHIVPSSNENIDLGSATNRFKELFLSGNTIDLGGALIKRVAGNTVELPVGSNINGKNIAATDQELNTTDAVTFANITTSGYLRGPASFVIDPAAFGDDTGTVVIAGNLQVDGTTTTINSTTVAIDDLNFSIATDAADSAAANGAGISIGGAGATLNYTHATTSWDMNKPLNVIDQFTIQDTTGDFDADTADARIVLKAGNTTAAEFGFTNTTSGQFVVRNKLDGDMRFRLETTSKKFRFEDTTGNNTIATISNSGLKIGGGNTSASEALEVVGNIVATGLTVTDAYAWLNIDGSSTAQYSGGNLWLSNSATANNYGVALSSQIANADTTGSTFALNEVSSAGSYSKTIFSYDHNNSTFSHNQYNYFNSGLGVAGDISVTGTVDGVDIATRDAVLTSTTTTAGAALPKAGGTMTGTLNVTQASTADTIKLTRGTTAHNNMIKFVTGSTDKWIVGQRNDSTDHFRFYSYGTSSDVLSIQTDGNVGIGTISPNFPLSFGANIGKTIALFENAGTSVYGIGMGGAGSAGDPYRTKIFSNGSERIAITDAGNVGIGAVPTKTLDINTASATFRIRDASAGNDFSFKTTAGPVSVIGCEANTSLALMTNNTERMRIDNVGNLQLGYGGQSPTAFAAPQGIAIHSLDNIDLQYYLRKGNQVEAHIGFGGSTNTNFYVGTGGGPGPGGIGSYGLYQANLSTTWTGTSDERLKTDLEPIENALDKVRGVRSYTGRFIHDEANGVTRRLPFLIAQDFVTALPEAVDNQDPDKLGLSYSDTVVLLFAAVNELIAENDTLKDRISALEG